MCGEKKETVQHILADAQKEYKRRQDNLAKRFHGELCKKNGLEYLPDGGW